MNKIMKTDSHVYQRSFATKSTIVLGVIFAISAPLCAWYTIGPLGALGALAALGFECWNVFKEYKTYKHLI